MLLETNAHTKLFGYLSANRPKSSCNVF